MAFLSVRLCSVCGEVGNHGLSTVVSRSVSDVASEQGAHAAGQVGAELTCRLSHNVALLLCSYLARGDLPG